MLLKIIFAFSVFIVLDAAFIYLNMDSFQNQVIHVQKVAMTAKPLGAIGAYLLLLLGLYYFILRKHRPVEEAALLGIVVNGVYEFTNYTLLKKWELSTVVKDTLWGGILWGLTTYITYSVFP